MPSKDYVNQRWWEKKIEAHLIGKTITKVRYLTNEETEEMCFHQRPIVIEFEDGSGIIPMRDDEGNDAGALWTSFPDLEVIPVFGRSVS